MELIRILRNCLLACDKDVELDAETVCASAYANFSVAPRKGLSFYDGTGATASVVRVALGVLLAKLTGHEKERCSWDDMNGCLISLEAIQASGANVYQDGKGETVFSDINEVHWAVDRVTARVLGQIVEAAVTPSRPVFIGKYELVAEYDHLVETNKLQAMEFGERACRDLAEVRNNKKYRMVKRKLDAADQTPPACTA